MRKLHGHAGSQVASLEGRINETARYGSPRVGNQRHGAEQSSRTGTHPDRDIRGADQNQAFFLQHLDDQAGMVDRERDDGEVEFAGDQRLDEGTR